jgi:hypothetical protein
MSKFQKVSDNSLEELMCLMADIQSRIEDYSHVSEFIPKSVSNVLNTFERQLVDEYDKRHYE